MEECAVGRLALEEKLTAASDFGKEIEDYST